MAEIITVSTLDELYDALANAEGGETILLEGGDYGDFYLGGKSGFDTTFPSNVTIASADPENPAVFSSMDVRDSSNLTFDGIVFDYTFEAGDEIYYKPFSVTDSSNIVIQNSTFDGDVATGVSATSDGYGYAHGLTVRGCENVTVENNECYGFYKGMVFSESSGLVVVGNDLHSMRMDGMNFAEVTDVLIEGNYIHDFAGSPNSGDHCDMIQFWTNGTDSPSTDIIITGNILDIGEGTYTQSIFMRNELVDTGQAGEEMYYQNVVITDNLITNGHSHGITVGETDGLVISNNSVLHSDGGNPDGLDSSVEIPKINVSAASTNVTITQNATHSITGWSGQSDWVVSNNAFVQDQDPNAPGYYEDVFVTSTLQLIDGVHSYLALPGGMLDILQAGAPATLTSQNDLLLDAEFQMSSSNDNAALRSFDASLTSTSLGDDMPEGTIYTWDFGDGTTASGAKVSHAFPDGGIYDVTLTVVLPDGTTDTQSLTVGVQGPTLVSMSPTGSFVAYEYGEEISLSTANVASAQGLQLGALGSAAILARQHFSDIKGADDVRIDFTIRADTPTSTGELFQLPGSFILSVTSTGELHARIWTASGEVKITTSGAGLSDMAAHDISIHVTDTGIAISVDGEILGSAVVSSGMAYTGANDLFIGNAWNKQNFNGDLLAFEISANADDFDAVAVTEPTPVDPPTAPVAEDQGPADPSPEPVPEEPATPDDPKTDPVAENPVEPAPSSPRRRHRNPSPKNRSFRGPPRPSPAWTIRQTRPPFGLRSLRRSLFPSRKSRSFRSCRLPIL
jgi:hypothetical protein